MTKKEIDKKLKAIYKKLDDNAITWEELFILIAEMNKELKNYTENKIKEIKDEV